MKLVLINETNFDELVAKSDKTVLLDFYADWCAPCRMVAPIIEEIANENDDILVGKINVDKEVNLAKKFNVFSIPTLAVVKNGKVVYSEAGFKNKDQILSLVK